MIICKTLNMKEKMSWFDWLFPDKHEKRRLRDEQRRDTRDIIMYYKARGQGAALVDHWYPWHLYWGVRTLHDVNDIFWSDGKPVQDCGYILRGFWHIVRDEGREPDQGDIQGVLLGKFTPKGAAGMKIRALRRACGYAD
jgi:hypothetical protein